ISLAHVHAHLEPVHIRYGEHLGTSHLGRADDALAELDLQLRDDAACGRDDRSLAEVLASLAEACLRALHAVPAAAAAGAGGFVSGFGAFVGCLSLLEFNSRDHLILIELLIAVI